MRIYSFPAVVGTAPRILILGSMPGVASLDAGEYYAHPRNQFWSIVMALCGTDAQLSYEERLRVLRDHGLALWDVLHSCLRPGSLDASIEHRSAKPNDLMALLRRAGSIRRLCCNGGTAHSTLKRYFGQALASEFPQIELYALPSTSPANASWSYARKLTAWKKALQPALD